VRLARSWARADDALARAAPSVREFAESYARSQTATRRLQQVLEDDLRALRAQQGRKPHRAVVGPPLPPVLPHFRGRAAERRRLRELLDAPQHRVVLVC